MGHMLPVRLEDSWRSGLKVLLQLACFCFLALAVCLLSGGVAAVFELAPGSTPQQWLFAATTPLSIPLICLLAYCFYRVHKITVRGGASVTVCSAVLVLLYCIGSVAAQTNSITPLYRSGVLTVAIWLSFIAVTLFVRPFLGLLYAKVRATIDKCFAVVTRSKSISYWLYLAILLIAWMPYLVIFAPGSPIGFDFSWQISQFFGYADWDAHHPLFSSIIYGIVAKAGWWLGGDNGAIMFVICFQACCFASAFSFELWVMATKLKAPKWTIVLAIAFYALLPIFGSFCQWCIKDSLFAAAFAVYVTVLIILATNEAERSKAHLWVLVTVSAAAVGLLRNNGIYVVILSLPFLALVIKKRDRRRPVLLTVLSALLIIQGGNFVLAQSLNAKDGSVREALSVPMQQTARYVLEHPDDVADWERDAISEVLPYDLLSDVYLWNYSDRVKERFKENGSLAQYFKAWAAQGLRHPATYAEATVLNSYGFWYVEPHPSYPFYFASFGQDTTDSLSEYLYMRAYFESDGQEAPENAGELRGEFHWSYFLPESVRMGFRNLIDTYREVPFVDILCQPAIYTWLVLLELFYLLYCGRKRQVIILFACIALILTCIAGPVNGYFRYMLGVVAVAPITLWATLYFGRERDEG